MTYINQFKNDVIVITDARKMIKSEAFKDMSSRKNGGVGIRVYLIFLTFRRIKKVGKKGHERVDVINKRELNFTYKTAVEKYGISTNQFTGAIDLLIEYGFLDIVQSSAGMQKIKSIYGLSERWRRYGKKDFIKGNPRTKQKRFFVKDEQGKFCKK